MLAFGSYLNVAKMGWLTTEPQTGVPLVEKMKKPACWRAKILRLAEVESPVTQQTGNLQRYSENPNLKHLLL
jgi:hypothetical protein